MAIKSPILMYARRILQDAIDRIDRGDDDCSEEVVARFIEKVNVESKGYFSKESFVNYDDAMRIMGIGNRCKMKNILNKHGVKMHKVNNQRVGFLRSEVEAVTNRLQNGTRLDRKRQQRVQSAGGDQPQYQ